MALIPRTQAILALAARQLSRTTDDPDPLLAGGCPKPSLEAYVAAVSSATPTSPDPPLLAATVLLRACEDLDGWSSPIPPLLPQYLIQHM